MTLETNYPDYRTLVEHEAPLGFARHFALSEWLDSRAGVSSTKDSLLCPDLPPLPAHHLGDFARADNRFRWADSPLAQGFRELGMRKEGFSLLAAEGFDADELSPLEMGAACSALLTPAAAFVALISGVGFGLFLVEAPLDLRQLSVSSTMASMREAARYCQATQQEWVPPLLDQLGFRCEPDEQGATCRRGEEHFRWSFGSERPELAYGESRARLLTTVSPSLAGLLEQGGSQEPATARQALVQAVALDPQSYEAQLLLGRVELSEGRPEQAELRLLLASLLRPGDSYALSLLVDCYALSDKVPQAIAVCERMLQHDPGNTAAMETMERLKGVL